jgi:Domain of unknown function (DUF4091)
MTLNSRRTSLLLSISIGCAGADLTALPEYLRSDPFGAIVEADKAAAIAPARAVSVQGARAGYVSFQLLAAMPESGEYTLDVEGFPRESGLKVDIYREWFHYVPSVKSYYPDALIPVRLPHRASMPEPDNRIAKQTRQAYWVDVWIPALAPPGLYQARAVLRAGGNSASVPITLRVLAAMVPAEDAVAIDHNSYGTSWLADQYPALRKRLGDGFFASPEFFALIQSYHRLFYEHRGVFHQLGYGHAGKVGPEFAPRLEGSGKTRHVADWTLFDKHYGPLFDGSAFASTRRGARPIPFVYLPINPEWPASQLWWGEPGYEREFVDVVSEMERHFRDKGWTQTRFELFFNHKKRYKGFSWDGDEARFANDYPYFREYARMMKAAVPAGSPVKFVFRADVSWTMERQFKDLAGVINMWVCGGGMFGWYPEAGRMLKDRGDVVWIYGGTPPVTEPSSHITTDVLRPWLWGIDGFVRWQTASPGADPWFQSDGGGEALIYPGDRFGMAEPISSIRLKIERNAVQDVTLLNGFRGARPVEAMRAEAARRYNGASVSEWRSPRPALADTNPEDWSNADIDDAIPKNPKFSDAIDAGAWQRVRAYVLDLASEVR